MRYLIIVLFFLILTGCQATTNQTGAQAQLLQQSNGNTLGQKIAFIPPRQVSWRQQGPIVLANGAITRTYLPMFQSQTHWDQAFNETYYPKYLFSGRPQVLLKTIERITRGTCHEVNFKMLSSKKSATTYTSSGFYCENGNERFETGKIMLGANGLYLLQYMARPNKVSERSIQFGMNAVMAGRLGQ